MENKTLTPRLDIREVAPAITAHMRGFRRLVEETSLDARLREIVAIRASQINGCVFCLDMHLQEARKLGISEGRLDLLCVWRDTPLFSEAERAALALTEAVTRIADGGVPGALYEEVRHHYTAEQYIGLLTTINVINAWNRFMIAS